MPFLNLAELEEAALECLPRNAADYYRSGARDEHTLQANRDAWAGWSIRYRCMVDTSHRTCGTGLLGLSLPHPIGVAPTAFHGLAHPEGECETARGLDGALMCVSTLSNRPIEDIVAAATGPVLFQLYLYKDRGAARALLQRAAAASVRAIVWTVDAPILGVRERDVRNRFQLPPELHLPHVAPMARLPADEGSALAAWVAKNLDPAISWDDLAWIREASGLPVIVKGIVRGDDAARAVDAGASAVVVSNHGGRQLDGAIATARALPDVVDAVAGQAPVWVDGGIRRGVDVLRALCLGAQYVLVGRPALWGLATGGADGVRSALQMLRDELHEAMGLAGVNGPNECTRDLLTGAHHPAVVVDP